MQGKACFGRVVRPLLSLLWRPRPEHQQRQQFSGSLKVPPDIGIAGYSLLAIPVATFALGTWQVRRRRWKLQLIDNLAKKTTVPVVEFPENLSELNDMEYQRVRVTGTFDHQREMYVGPRSRIEPVDESAEASRKRSGGLISAPGQTGNLVITPFKLKDRNLTILVNRGWVPRSMTAPHKRPQGQIEGELELVGVVRKTEKRPPLGPKNPSKGQFWHYKDVEQMADACGAAPILLDATSESTVEGGPIGGQTMVTLRNEHFSYILTWYSLSAATSFLWYHKYIRRRPLM